jgi:hypothetical protein
MLPLADDGFSQSVVARLPQPRRPFHGLIWPLAGTGAGIAFAVARSRASWSALGPDAPEWTINFASLLSTLANPWFLLALAMTGASLLIAYAFTRPSARWL